jgi:hypothetical protein
MDNPLQPSDPARATLRASDMDRERVATVLRDNYAEGRLSLEEMQERLEQAYASKTLGELDTLTRDLPQLSASTRPTAAVPVTDRIANRRRIRDRVLTYVILMLFLIAIWATSGRHGSFWPIWPILVGALILAFDVLHLEHPGAGRRRHRDRAEHRCERWERRTGRGWDDRDDTR